MSTSDSSRILAPGKVSPELLADLLEGCALAARDPDVLVPPRPGEDGAVVRVGGRSLVIGTDPITFATPRPGYFAVVVNANDIAAMGARPRFFTLTILMPPGASEGALRAIMADAIAAGEALSIALIGGHTEVTPAVRQPVLSVTMMGEPVRETALCTGGALPGDMLVQAGYAALEGTAILACDHRDALCSALGEGMVSSAASLIENPGICVLDAALAISPDPGVHALHDPTEGGIATGILEMASAAGLGVRVDRARLRYHASTDPICRELGVDPCGLISSGCLLAAVSPDAVSGVLEILDRPGRPASVIGRFRADGEVGWVGPDGRGAPIPRFAADELARDL